MQSGAADRLRMCMEIAQVIKKEFPGRTLSGIGGVESGNDAAQFILLGCDTVQVCTYVMKVGYRCIHDMCKELSAFMDQARFKIARRFQRALACNTSRRITIWCIGRRKHARRKPRRLRRMAK